MDRHHPLTSVTASDSSSVTRVLKRPANKTFEQLCKFYGVNADIYRLANPLHAVKSLHGIYDNDLDYESEPVYKNLRVLIPSIYRRRNAMSLVFLDPFIDSDTYLYVPDSIDIPDYALIIGRLPNKKLFNFKVVAHDAVGNDSGWLIHRYSIVPVLTQDIERNREEIIHHIQEEAIRIQKGDQVDISTNQPNYNLGSYDSLPID